MNIQLCTMTLEAFTALAAANNLYCPISSTAQLGSGFFLYCDGANLFLQHDGTIKA